LQFLISRNPPMSRLLERAVSCVRVMAEIPYVHAMVAHKLSYPNVSVSIL
jgi:hypothetical protein